MKIPENLKELQVELGYDFHYNLVVDSSESAHQLFLEIWEQDCRKMKSGWYTLFLAKEKSFFNWYKVHHVKNTKNGPMEALGLAIAMGMRSLYVAHMYSGCNAKLGYQDIIWLNSLRKLCNKNNIKLQDYLLITSNEWSSYCEEADKQLD